MFQENPFLISMVGMHSDCSDNYSNNLFILTQLCEGINFRASFLSIDNLNDIK